MLEEVRKDFLEAVTAYEKGRQKGIDYYMKKKEEAIPLDGKFYTIDRPEIRTSFCFGSGYCGVSTLEEDEAASSMAHYAKTNQDYFIKENMEGIEGIIKRLKEDAYWYVGSNHLREDYPFIEISSSKAEPWYDEKGRLHNPNNYDFIFWKRLLTDEERKEILEAYQRVKTSFEKRLKTYLKRYGMSKIRTWTYISD